MSRALGVPDVEARLMRQLVEDRKRATPCRERIGFDVVETLVVPVSNTSYGMAIWLSERTGGDVMDIIATLGAEVDRLVAVEP